MIFYEKTVADEIILAYKESNNISPTEEIPAKMYRYEIINESGKGAIFFHVLNENIGLVGYALYIPLSRKLNYYDWNGNFIKINNNMEFES